MFVYFQGTKVKLWVWVVEECYDEGDWVSLCQRHLGTFWIAQKEKAIGCKWVFAKKEGSQAATVRYKARLVANGYAQRNMLIIMRYSCLLWSTLSFVYCWNLHYNMTMSWTSSIWKPSFCTTILRRRSTWLSRWGLKLQGRRRSWCVNLKGRYMT